MHIVKLLQHRFPNQQQRISLGLTFISASALLVGLGWWLFF